MPARSRKGSNNGDTYINGSELPPSDKPVIIEWGKKFAAYDKFGKLIILGYNRRIVEEYANEQGRLRSKRQRKD
jgi:hypothetical protein